jgi:hypothetical protein
VTRTKPSDSCGAGPPSASGSVSSFTSDIAGDSCWSINLLSDNQPPSGEKSNDFGVPAPSTGLSEGIWLVSANRDTAERRR